MKKFPRLFSLIGLFLFSAVLVSQNETAKWYFNTNAGLDFMTEPPTILTNGILTNGSGSSIANSAGDLLFYTNSTTVWNKLHQVMANGTGLIGSSGLIVKQPGTSSLYYIFTIAPMASYYYSVVDMNLAAGNGSIIIKNTFLHSPTTSKLAATKHCNGTDVWVVSHDWNSNDFRSYLLTSVGIQTNAVISSIGTVHTGFIIDGAIGAMKISPNGKKIGLVIPDPINDAELYDFDNVTGIVSNSLVLSNLPFGPHCCEFSPDGTKFYAGLDDPSSIYQWNLCPGPFSGSKFLVGYHPTGDMQLARNGKIYIGYSGDLSVINTPDLNGAACNFTTNGQSLSPNMSSWNLPTFVSSYLKKLPSLTYTIAGINCDSIRFSTSAVLNVSSNCSAASNPITEMFWLFGDPASGQNNSSTLSHPFHNYPGPGTYTVKLVLLNSCSADTVIQPVLIAPCIDTSISTGLNSLDDKMTFKVYPNPNTGRFFLETALSTRIILYDNLGSAVIDRILKNGSHSIDLGSMANGFYSLKIISDRMTKTFKINKTD